MYIAFVDDESANKLTHDQQAIWIILFSFLSDTFVLNCDYQSFSMFGVSESLCFSDYII